MRDEATAVKVMPAQRLISLLLSHAYMPPDKRAPPKHISTINILLHFGGVSLGLTVSYHTGDGGEEVPHYTSYTTHLSTSEEFLLRIFFSFVALLPRRNNIM